MASEGLYSGCFSTRGPSWPEISRICLEKQYGMSGQREWSSWRAGYPWMHHGGGRDLFRLCFSRVPRLPRLPGAGTREFGVEGTNGSCMPRVLPSRRPSASACLSAAACLSTAAGAVSAAGGGEYHEIGVFAGRMSAWPSPPPNRPPCSASFIHCSIESTNARVQAGHRPAAATWSPASGAPESGALATALGGPARSKRLHRMEYKAAAAPRGSHPKGGSGRCCCQAAAAAKPPCPQGQLRSARTTT